MKRLLPFLLLALFQGFGFLQAGIIYVASDAAPGGDGSSWASAYIDLQDAIDAADPTDGDGIDQVWVKTGTYYPTENIFGNPEGVDLFNPDLNVVSADLTFRITQSIEIYGGFTGTETLLIERNPTASVTTLSGDFDPVIVSDNVNRLVWIQDITGSTLSNVVLDGFSITGATARGAIDGGGVYAVNVDPLTLRNLTITDCTSGDNGGGMYLYAPNVITMEDITIENCYAGTRGGGIFLQNTSQTAILNINGLTLRSNSADNDGGGAYLRVLTDCEILNAEIVNNTSAGDGGGLHFRGRNSTSNINIKLVHATFYGNSAPLGSGGGLFTEVNAGVQVYNSIFYANSDQTGTTTPTSQLGRVSNSINDVAYSLVQGSGGSGAGWLLNGADDQGNNVDFDPQFVDPDGADDILGTEDDNLSLSALSAANNLGTTTIPNLSSYPTEDLGGLSRVQNTAPDLGAFEGPYGVSFPVEWLSFTANLDESPVGEQALLTWKTAQETQSSHFVVERAVGEALDWEPIGSVAAARESQTVRTYDWTDKSVSTLPASATLYYRLKQVDLDGQHSFSEVLSLQRETSRLLTVAAELYPNPAQHATTLALNFSDLPTVGRVRLLTLSGQAIWQQAIEPAATNAIALPLTDVPAGLYWVEVVYDGNRTTRKLQVEK